MNVQKKPLITNILKNYNVYKIINMGNGLETLSYSPSKMDKLFCPRCGSDTMTKLSVYVNDKGGLRYGFKKNYRVKTRGTKFAIAKTKGGRKDQGLLLREDQMLSGQWKITARKKEKMESNEYINDTSANRIICS